MEKNIKFACFAGGCFWCLEEAFSNLKGVIKVINGYSFLDKLSLDKIKILKHLEDEEIIENFKVVESVFVVYDKNEISYKELLKLYLSLIDPTDDKGQFVDRGDIYSPIIFYFNNFQKGLCIKVLDFLKSLIKENIKIKIKPFKFFIKASELHQQYFLNFPFEYENYKKHCGRFDFQKVFWIKKNYLKALEDFLKEL